ncbi:endonuclease [Phytoactinopolyspora alkaliphila]|uniref:Endonuclease n=1 Tax=Phytoactinopolyspora alkaliphila TaxID=1783498 RepID=A0A6N9YPV7_9ACTN|nr:endonuclease [Phytoactinopolyspora alkaliphila]NED96975.1 endonuclease [Phytoactinopolyspora alkaliphila]
MAPSKTAKSIAAAALDRHGRTFAAQAGIRLADKPSPLYRLLVLAMLLSARISSQIAVDAARELSRAGYRTPRRMAEATWQERVDALGRGHYRRYDERTATMLGEGAGLLLDRYGGDLRRLYGEAAGVDELERRLQEFPGIGPTGAAIFCREVQGEWRELAPYADQRVLDGAEKLGLPASAARLGELVPAGQLPRLMAACVRAAQGES